MRLLFAFAAVLTVTCTAHAQPAPCSAQAQKLGARMPGVASFSPLEILLQYGDVSLGPTSPPDNWTEQTPAVQSADRPKLAAKLRADALKLFTDFLSHCAPEDLVAGPAQDNQRLAVLGEPRARDALLRVAAAQSQLSPVLAALMAAPGGVESARPAQLSLTQLVSAGQPGFAVGAAFTPGARAPDRLEWLRHLSVDGSVVLLQPALPGGPAEQSLAYGEFGVFYSTQTTAYDVARRISSHLGEDESKKINPLRGAALVALGHCYKERRPEGGAPADDVFTECAARAQHDYLAKAVEDVYVPYYEAVASPNGIQFQIGIRGREAKDLTYVPNIPDLESYGVDARLDVLVAGSPSDYSLAVSLAATGAYSRWDAAVYKTRGSAPSSVKGSALLDARLGVVLGVPATSGPPAKLRLAATGRLAGETTDALGGALSISVPMSAGLAFVGGYLFTCPAHHACAATTSFSIAIAADQAAGQ